MIKISKELERKLRGIYDDCLEIEKKKDLTEHGEGMLDILNRLCLK